MLDTDYTVEMRAGGNTTGKIPGKVFERAVKMSVESAESLTKATGKVLKKSKSPAAAGIEDNVASEAKIDTPSAASNDLKAFIERIERLEEEKAATAGDISEVYADAKATGFNVKIMRKIVRLRARDKTEIDEEAALVKLYAEKIGMQLELAF